MTRKIGEMVSMNASCEAYIPAKFCARRRATTTKSAFTASVSSLPRARARSTGSFGAAGDESLRSTSDMSGYDTVFASFLLGNKMSNDDPTKLTASGSSLFDKASYYLSVRSRTRNDTHLSENRAQEQARCNVSDAADPTLCEVLTHEQDRGDDDWVRVVGRRPYCAD